MGVAVSLGIEAAVRPREDATVRIYSEAYDACYETTIDAIKRVERDHTWVNYALGVFLALQQHGMRAETGFELATHSSLPLGAGMSSSAAVELAVAYALAGCYGFEADKVTFARLCREAENDFVGMPCGILDQGVSAFGKVNHLVTIDCHTETFDNVPLPTGVHFHVFNSTKKHALVDSLYAERHAECKAVYACLRHAHPELPCLAHATMEQLKAVAHELTPEQYRRGQHVVEEGERVAGVQAALQDGDIASVGRMLTASHESSRTLFENSCDELDFLVNELTQQSGVYGARLTGGGFGGAVMALTSDAFCDKSAAAVLQAYQNEYKEAPLHIHCLTGDGASLLRP